MGETLAMAVTNSMQGTFLRVWAADMLADTWRQGRKRAYLRPYERGYPSLLDVRIRLPNTVT
jgi:hypothetical protein